MTPEKIGARLVESLGSGRTVSEDGQSPGDGVTTSVSGGGIHARAVVDVPPRLWREALAAARDDLGCDFFDWLSAVDQGDGTFDVVAHVWSLRERFSVLLRARLSGENPTIDTIVDIYPGASWNERETHEMFGIDIAGHPHLVPLLLSNEFEGHPLRKDFVLASRVVKPWPGAKEPGGEGGGKARQPMRPLGVPDPTQWGPTVTTTVD